MALPSSCRECGRSEPFSARPQSDPIGEVARLRGASPEETAIDLVIEDHSRIGVAYTVISEANLRREVALPWMSFCSDEAATIQDHATYAHPQQLASGTSSSMAGLP